MYEALLQSLGLNENEAQIYEILLNSGILPVREILKKTALKRSNLYNVLGSLEKMGLISQKLGKNGITVFYPETPDKLEDLVNNQEKQLSQSKSQLAGNLFDLKNIFMFSQEKPVVKFFEGEEGIKKTMFDSLNAKGEICTFMDAEGIERYAKKMNQEYIRKRQELQIPKKIIAADTPFAREHYKKVSQFTEVRLISPEIKPFKTGTQIYNNTVSYTTLNDKKMIGVIIEDENIAQMNRSLFEYIWSTLKIFSNT